MSCAPADSRRKTEPNTVAGEPERAEPNGSSGAVPDQSMSLTGGLGGRGSQAGGTDDGLATGGSARVAAAAGGNVEAGSSGAGDSSEAGSPFGVRDITGTLAGDGGRTLFLRGGRAAGGQRE